MMPTYYSATLSLGNDAMQTSQDVAKVLRLLADKLDHGGFPAGREEMIRDDNGNIVGRHYIDKE